MPEKTAAIIDTFYDAWNRHDAAAVAASFAADGVYADPLTRRASPATTSQTTCRACST